MPLAGPDITVGISGARHNAAAALCLDGELAAFCEQERLTRQRGAGPGPGTIPDEAIRGVLETGGGFERVRVRTFATAEQEIELPATLPTCRVDHHEAHAATAFHLSEFEDAAVFVSDRTVPGETSVWVGRSGGLRRHRGPFEVGQFAVRYARAARSLGFAAGQEHQLESLARLGVTNARSREAAACQRELGEELLAVLTDVKTSTGSSRLCLAGGLFYNTWFNTLIRQTSGFDDVFVPANPGNAGTAIGAALVAAQHAGRTPRATASPFLGPSFTLEDIKRTLDNCKLSAECLSEREVVDRAAAALEAGLLVGWFQGRMEWGHRALGNRSILANPLSPYVLDNLNVFLKHRERHRTYGVSVPEECAHDFFDGPSRSRYMEYEYRPREPERFRAILPEGVATLRVQTVAAAPDESTTRFRNLHARFAARTGVPVLVNTSFNGFAEPIVCSPRDAIRVFFGTGLDVLILDRFVLAK
jgi:carbamoyltransferase